VAVLSIDPSSARSGGSILGDKTRMTQLACNQQAFIRPSPAGRTLGGVARRTREAMLLCEAAGFDVVIIETVGVGQSEIAVADMTDMFLLLLLPSGGDDLQGIKRGIMELADLVLVNKADGDLLPAARRAATDYGHALRMMQPRSSYWRPQVKLCSALEHQGIADVWQTVLEYQTALSKAGLFEQQRQTQSKTWLWQELREGLLLAFAEHAVVRQRLASTEQAVMAGVTSAPIAAQQLLQQFLAEKDSC
jgi:LAO/AO transport system kinase